MDIHWPYPLEEDLLHPRDITQAWRDIDHLQRVNWQEGKIRPTQQAHYMALYNWAVQ